MKVNFNSGENGSFTFSFTNTSNDQFYIEPETGVVILTKPLDRELVSSYDLSIEVSLISLFPPSFAEAKQF